MLDTRGHLLVALGYGLWPSMVLISEIVQTFILADFCYYYVKRFIISRVIAFTRFLPPSSYHNQLILSLFYYSVFGGQLVLRLPSGVV